MMTLEIAEAYNGYLYVVMITLSLSYVCQSSIQKFRKPTRSCWVTVRGWRGLRWWRSDDLLCIVVSPGNGARSLQTTPPLKGQRAAAWQWQTDEPAGHRVVAATACWCPHIPNRLLLSSRYASFPILVTFLSSQFSSWCLLNSSRNCTVQVSGLDHVGCVIEDQAEHKAIRSNSIAV